MIAEILYGKPAGGQYNQYAERIEIDDKRIGEEAVRHLFRPFTLTVDEFRFQHI